MSRNTNNSSTKRRSKVQEHFDNETGLRSSQDQPIKASKGPGLSKRSLAGEPVDGQPLSKQAKLKLNTKGSPVTARTRAKTRAGVQRLPENSVNQREVIPKAGRSGLVDLNTTQSLDSTKQPIVASTSSLIKSIKASRIPVPRKNRKVLETSTDSTVSRGRSSDPNFDLNALSQGHTDYDRYHDDDGVQVGVESGEDDYQNSQESEEEESDEEGAVSSSDEESFYESEGDSNARDPEVSFKNDTEPESERENSDSEELDPEDPRVKRLLAKLMSEEGSKGGKRKQTLKNKGNANNPNYLNQVKSPSDTTIYMPALAKEFVSPTSIAQKHVGINNEISNHISNFVEKIRGEATTSRQHTPDRGETTPNRQVRLQQRTDYDERNGGKSRHKELSAAQSTIIQAEKFKAIIEPPKGKPDQGINEEISHVLPGVDTDLNSNIKELIDILKSKSGLEQDNDDDFMHVTCHIDDVLRQKIGRGEFVDLERLLPKSRAQTMAGTADDDIQVIRKDGSKFILPGGDSKDNRINNIRRWEQAFRVYAAVYSEINPQRSSEIWQYVHIINTASSSYSWENVAFYDFTFRQLMERKPHRSWAKIYTQMWNLALTDQVNRGSGSFQKGNGYQQQQQAQNNQQHKTGKHGDWRDRCCWRYNKGKCTKWNCKFDHRCNIKECGSYSHNAQQCNKKGEVGHPEQGTIRTNKHSRKFV